MDDVANAFKMESHKVDDNPIDLFNCSNNFSSIINNPIYFNLTATK